MPHVKGFRGYRFNPAKAGNFDNVITPPFDVISPAEREALAQRSPFNMVHLILPEARGGLDRYQHAGRLLERMLAEGVLIQDESESLYLLEQRFQDNTGRERLRRAFYAVTKIPETGERTVLGHEKTFAHKIEDRLALMRATRMNFGAVFVMYSDPEGTLQPVFAPARTSPPDIVARTIDGVEQRLWRVPFDPRVAEFLAGRHLYIGDGHHRYATAVAYRDERRAAERPNGPRPYDYVMMGFIALEDPGLVVYPAHRLLDGPAGLSAEELRRRLASHFELAPVEGDLPGRVAAAANGTTIGLAVHGDGQWLLHYKHGDRRELLGDDHGPAWRDLDVAVLHRGIIENLLGMKAGEELVYEPDAAAALALCRRGEKRLAFIINPATPGQIRACAEAGEYMPQKATYLFPKLPTGPVLYRLD